MAEKKTDFLKSTIGILGAIQSELKAPKNQYNSFGDYNYRSLEDILEGVKPLLKKYNAVLYIYDEVVCIGEERWYVKATAEFHTEYGRATGVGLAREAETKKGMDASQITGAASSYARKYALNGLFAIDDVKDADTMDNTEKAVGKKTGKKKAKKTSDDDDEL